MRSAPLVISMIREREAIDYLLRVKELKKEGHRFFDMHAHPFEIIWNKFDYRDGPDEHGLFGTSGINIPVPTVTDLRIEALPLETEIPNRGIFEQAMFFKFRRIYGRVGPQIFQGQMELSGIDTTLLLPVPPRSGRFEEQMAAMAGIFGGTPGFLLAGSVAVDVTNEGILADLKRLKGSFDIRAVKIHPCISGIDSASAEGRERIEAILCACDDLSLPLIVHGGRRSLLWNAETADYGAIERLEKIDWGISSYPVIIAHAGCHSYRPDAVRREVLPILKGMLSWHANLMIDLSGLEVATTTAVLEVAATDRMVFGSDALYEPQWSAVVRIYYALSQTTNDPDGEFIKIAERNPRSILLHEPAPAA